MKTMILVFLMFVSFKLAAQKNGYDYFPSKLNICPLTANFLEPRLGTDFEAGDNRLWLNIGNSFDIIHYKGDESLISLGADLFTWTRLRSTNNFKFPVETVDYLFGINAGYKYYKCSFQYGLRIRISHISAHLVDGQYEWDDGQWRDNYEPFVYSREFIDFIGFYRINNLRTYAGGNIVFHTIPAGLGVLNLQAGIEYYWQSFLSNEINPFIAYDFKLTDINEYYGSNSIKAGLKLGKPYTRGISVYYNYYSGKSIHGMFYNIDRSYHSVGLNLDI
jgi:hypothetical protein